MHGRSKSPCWVRRRSWSGRIAFDCMCRQHERCGTCAIDLLLVGFQLAKLHSRPTPAVLLTPFTTASGPGRSCSLALICISGCQSIHWISSFLLQCLTYSRTPSIATGHPRCHCSNFSAGCVWSAVDEDGLNLNLLRSSQIPLDMGRSGLPITWRTAIRWCTNTA